MKSIMCYIYLIILLLVLIYFSSKSSFGNTSILTGYTNCQQNEISDTDRIYPSGHIPGSYLGLSPGEKQELLKRFVENES